MAVEQQTQAQRHLELLRAVIAIPSGAELIAWLLEEEGWRCTPPKSPQTRAAQAAGELQRKGRA